ncbi:uncharacterized protein LOC127850612 isoform X11 [Dreissena polymorpha]|uniref:uncharacterized protein LOC127850612 isoform X10 n=1 Tax=Dreissena polymorpha TaxID=45954 RepID=UPI0022642E09|nr:uncharacterized protein LOC127850612 isoform X10 [Dreissena polymorpha]XP_052239736.1 uncharacterized protein LOC127850612 isoform X11 [Dreissena polymorpha]
MVTIHKFERTSYTSLKKYRLRLARCGTFQWIWKPRQENQGCRTRKAILVSEERRTKSVIKTFNQSCSGHLQAAVRVLEDVERRYHSEVKAVCIVRRLEGDRDLKVFANMLAGNKEEEISELPFAFCVRFVRQESYCTPAMLLFEMNRNITQEEVANRLLVETLWMDSAEVDARPFLYYMQYITYGGLGERDKQLHAMGVLEAYIDTCIRNQLNLYHLETALNLLGHCYEMEGDYAGALDYYELSLSDERTNNAANWHILRIMRLISG